MEPARARSWRTNASRSGALEYRKAKSAAASAPQSSTRCQGLALAPVPVLANSGPVFLLPSDSDDAVAGVLEGLVGRGLRDSGGPIGVALGAALALGRSKHQATHTNRTHATRHFRTYNLEHIQIMTIIVYSVHRKTRLVI